MDDQLITQKLENLMKYLPFIDFVLKIDKQKYFKFVDIRKWIASKKRYPLSDLQKIEQSLVTQYKNLLLDDHKIPKDIIKIFNGEINHQYVNLCSDDEEDRERNNETSENKKEEKNRSSKKHTERERKSSSSNYKKEEQKYIQKHREKERKSFSSSKEDHKQSTKLDEDDDDDLEIVSFEYLSKEVREENQQSTTDDKLSIKDSPKKELDLDEISAELLRKIDVLNEDDNKFNNCHEPINYHKHSDEDGDDKTVGVGNLFERRKSGDLLFKRRDDFKALDDLARDTENMTKHKMQKKRKSDKHKRRDSSKFDPITRTLETISLDSSSSESEELNLPTTSAKAIEAIKTTIHCTPANSSTVEEDELNESPPSTGKSHDLGADEIVVDVNTILNVEKETENQQNSTIQNSVTSDRVICSTKTTIEDSTLTSTNSDHSLDNDVDILDMDIDTENDLNDVIKEIESSPERNVKTTSMQCDKPQNFRNPSPPPQGVEAKSVENTSSSNAQINSSATSNISSDDLHNLTQEQILNIFEDIQTKSDFELDKILKNLATVFDDNKEHTNSATTVSNQNYVAPPAPHMIPSPLQPTPAQQLQPIFCPNPIMPPQFLPQPIYHHPQQQYPPQQQQQSVPLQYNESSTFVPMPRMGHRINIKDPRILKQLHQIHKSPVWSELTRESAGILLRRSQPEHYLATTHYQQPQHDTVFSSNNSSNSATVPLAPINNRQKSATKSSITYADYKRRKIEQQEQLKRKQEEEERRKVDEQKAKQAEEAKAMEQREHLKQTDEIRSILLSTLEPYKDKISTIWEQHNQSNSGIPLPAKKDEGITNKPQTKNGENPSKVIEKVKNNTAISNKSVDGQKQINNKINRIHKELECTVKGFDQLHDYVPKTLAGRRRSSIHARSIISEQLNSEQPTTDYSEQSPKAHSDMQEQMSYSDSSDTNSHPPKSAAGSPKHTGSKRRSSIFARSAIEKQLRQQHHSSDCSDSDFNMSSQSTIDREVYTSASITKRRKTIDEPIHAKRRVNTFVIRDDESTVSVYTSSDEEEDSEKARFLKNKRLKEKIIANQPKIVLRRMSDDFIRKHSKRKAPALISSDVFNVHLVKSTKANTVEKLSSPPVAKKILKPKRLNNDCQMTERNSRFCALCTSKPSDLTNHYIRKHKTESYVSRLSYSKLEDLAFNTTFAKLQSGKFRSKYLVQCAFCDQELVEPFMELYDHYSFHTGEFAYQCGHCQLEKPFRSEITAHQKRSKTCRNNNVRVLYRYPPKSHCIYLYFCIICNFVQLNEANVMKHLREHHNPRDAVEKNVGKCILAAISDAPEINEKQEHETTSEKGVLQTINVTPLKEVKKSELDFKVDDDDIPVNNEPCSEDIFEEGKLSPEELLQKMHEEPTTSSAPMTVIHCGTKSSNIYENNTTSLTKTVDIPPRLPIPAPTEDIAQRHLPMIIKVEEVQVDESPLITPPRPTSSSSSVTENALTGLAVANEPSTLNRKPNMTSVRIKVENTVLPAPAYSTTPVAVNSITEKINDASTIKGNPDISKLYPVYEKYHTYPTNVNYLGLYKCMADDCYYSTDSSDEFSKHLYDHSQDCIPTEYLHCPYCTISENIQITATQLIEHIRNQHQHMIFQCSICCYRSCVASNVAIHQQQIHADATNLQIFKCSGTEVNPIEKQAYTNEKILTNVKNIKCPYCSTHKYYNSNLMRQHINQFHKVNVNYLKVYSCIYCKHIEKDENCIRKHVSTKHPEELPYIYDHNTFVVEKQDAPNNSNILNLAQTVEYEEVKPISDSVAENLEQDVKPALEELVKMNEDTVKIRLRKLTTHTGVAPDSLYRCPEPACGGFFSVYDLWLRHMKVRHRCLECQCPHCPTENNNNDNHSLMRTLESYAEHFEEHRRHIYICFHCSITMRNENVAKQHATEQHSNLGTMRFEQVRYNLNFSYFIMIQSGLFKERVEFITEFLPILDKRLKDLESIEIQKLKHRWLIQDDAIWLEDFPKFNFNNRRVAKKCVVSDCKFRSRDDDVIFNHLNAIHAPYSTNFNCKKCDKWVPIKNWNDISDHIKLHTDDTIFICGACLHTNACRNKLAEHIRDQHAARDVPVVELIRTSQQTTYIKLAIVLANNQLTFSTIRNCFCCSEMRMNGDAFILHLRRYHKLTLNYFCEWCSNTQFESLDEVSGHFKNSHPTANIKIRCELASKSDLIVISLNEFQLQIANEQQEMVMVKVKQEPNDRPTEDSDDDVILLEDNDVVIQESLRNQQLAGECEKPKIKCISMNNLLQNPSTSTLSTPILRVVPKVTITKIGEINTATSNTTATASAYLSSSYTTPSATSTISCFQNASNSDNQNYLPATVNAQNYGNTNNNLPSTSTQAQSNNNELNSESRKITPTNATPGVNHHQPSSSTPNANYARPIPSIITENNIRVNTHINVNPQYNVNHRMSPNYNVNAIINTHNVAPNLNTQNYNVNPSVGNYYNPIPNVNPNYNVNPANVNAHNYALSNIQHNNFHT